MHQRRQPRRAVCAYLGVCVLVIVVAGVWPAAAQEASLEYEVKTSYLFNFPQFVKWPPEVMADEANFNLCVLGADRFGATLDTIAGERVDGRAIVIHRLKAAADAPAAGCHLLFVAAVPGMAAEVEPRRGLLTVGETPGFLARGGIINLIEVNGRIRFQISRSAAEEAGLVISSRLLSLAVN